MSDYERGLQDGKFDQRAGLEHIPGSPEYERGYQDSCPDLPQPVSSEELYFRMCCVLHTLEELRDMEIIAGGLTVNRPALVKAIGDGERRGFVRPTADEIPQLMNAIQYLSEQEPSAPPAEAGE